MTIRFCSSSSCSHRHVSGIGMSLKFRFSCGMILLGCSRCYRHIGSTAQESIDQTAKAEQIIERADEQRSLWRAGDSLEICRLAPRISLGTDLLRRGFRTFSPVV